MNTRKPRVVENIFGQTIRFPTGSVVGTGVQTPYTFNGGLNGGVRLETGSAGRAYITTSVNLLKDRWYVMSYNVNAMTGIDTTAFQWGLSWPVNAPNQGDPLLSGTELLAGGVGRYANVFRSTVGGSSTFRLGLGLSANENDATMDLSNLMLELVDNASIFPGEYVYPSFKAAYGYDNHSTIAGKKVTFVKGPSFAVEAGNVILAIGDSRSDEVNDLANQLNNVLGSTGVVYPHAKGGWTTANVIAEETENSLTYSLDTALAGTLLRRTFSTAGVEQLYDLPDANQMRPDTLLIGNFGVNDIAGGSGSGMSVTSAMANFNTICNAAITAGYRYIVMTDNTPWNAAASFSATDGDLPATLSLNTRIAEYAKSKGFTFVKLYKEFGDSTDADKLSDGAGSTPDFSQDGIHTNYNGGLLVAALIKSGIELRNQ